MDDYLVWDVVHHAYPHKIITSRCDRIAIIYKNSSLQVRYPSSPRGVVRV
ncbi:MAG: 1-deoxy-D-xylulose-5-phosphate synthase N-terminal domain-containing protein [Candidatus Malihini olakiniferum]